MFEAMPLETKKEKLKEAFKILGHVLIVDVLPQVAKIALPILLAYVSRKAVDSNIEAQPNVPN